MVAPLPVREDFGADALGEMRAHYAASRARLLAPTPITAGPEPSIVKPEAAPCARNTEREAAGLRAEADRAARAAAVEAENERTWREFMATASEAQRAPRRSRVMLTVASKVTGIEREDILGGRRFSKVVKARHIYMALCDRFLGLNLPEIGRRCGGLDHTTALHGIRQAAWVAQHYRIPRSNDPAEWARALWIADWQKARRP